MEINFYGDERERERECEIKIDDNKEVYGNVSCLDFYFYIKGVIKRCMVISYNRDEFGYGFGMGTYIPNTRFVPVFRNGFRRVTASMGFVVMHTSANQGYKTCFFEI